METTLTTLKWAVLFMLHYPQVQDKLHKVPHFSCSLLHFSLSSRTSLQEVDEVLGGDGSASLDDKSRMPYTVATLHEVQRLANIVPFNLPHSVHRVLLPPSSPGRSIQSFQTTTLRGYDIPEGILVQPEISHVLMDENFFPEPQQFRPERFLDGKADALIPFSLGKRACLGESLARAELFLIFTALIHNYHIHPVHPHLLPSLEPLVGVTMAPQPYSVRIAKRH